MFRYVAINFCSIFSSFVLHIFAFTHVPLQKVQKTNSDKTHKFVVFFANKFIQFIDPLIINYVQQECFAENNVFIISLLQ